MLDANNDVHCTNPLSDKKKTRERIKPRDPAALESARFHGIAMIPGAAYRRASGPINEWKGKY
jgi:hypothetical protein